MGKTRSRRRPPRTPLQTKGAPGAQLELELPSAADEALLDAPLAPTALSFSARQHHRQDNGNCNGVSSGRRRSQQATASGSAPNSSAANAPLRRTSRKRRPAPPPRASQNGREAADNHRPGSGHEEDDVVAQLRRQRLQQQQREQSDPAQLTRPSARKPSVRLGNFDYCAKCHSYFPRGTHPPHLGGEDNHSNNNNYNDANLGSAARFRAPPFAPLLDPTALSRRTKPAAAAGLFREGSSLWFDTQLCSGAPNHQRRRLVEQWRYRLLFAPAPVVAADSSEGPPRLVDDRRLQQQQQCCRRPLAISERWMPWEESPAAGQFANAATDNAFAGTSWPAWSRTFDVLDVGSSAASQDDRQILTYVLSSRSSSLPQQRDEWRTETVRFLRSWDGLPTTAMGHLGSTNFWSDVGREVEPMNAWRFHLPLRRSFSDPPPSQPGTLVIPSAPTATWNDFAWQSGRRLILVGEGCRINFGLQSHFQGPWVCDLSRLVSPESHTHAVEIARRQNVRNFPASEALCVEVWDTHACAVVGHRSGQCTVWDDRSRNCATVMGALPSHTSTADARAPAALRNAVRLLPLPSRHQILVRGNGGLLCQLWDIRHSQRPVWNVSLDAATGFKAVVAVGPTQRSTGLATDPAKTLVLTPAVAAAAPGEEGPSLRPLLGAWSLDTGAFLGAESLLPAGRTITNCVSVELSDRRTDGWMWTADDVEGGDGSGTAVRIPGTWGLWYRLWGCPPTEEAAVPTPTRSSCLHHLTLPGRCEE